jgi:hypothetical protein
MVMMLLSTILECIITTETCITQKDFPIDVPTEKAFEAQIAESKKCYLLWFN